jgi:hypothetical protein
MLKTRIPQRGDRDGEFPPRHLPLRDRLPGKGDRDYTNTYAMARS